MTSKCKYAADGTPYAEVRMLNAEEYSVKELNIALKPEQGFGDFTFCFKDGTSATFKNAGSLQEFLDKLARHHELEKKLEIARQALKDIKAVCDNCRWCDSNLYDPTPNDGRRIAETTNNALTQIEHKESQ